MRLPTPCLRPPVPEIADAARYLDAAVSAHLSGRTVLAAELIRQADLKAVREWTESLWGPNGPWSWGRVEDVAAGPPIIPREQRIPARMPTKSEKQILLARDGHHCRFCGIPVIRTEVRQRMNRDYSAALPWGRTNREQHAAFQELWVQYDHLVPHARGGGNDLNNIVITCGPCNFGRMERTLEEVGLIDPRTRPPVRSSWDGLERYLGAKR
jgi:5-methylcytosine-specific restriction endonuclease McrA